MIVFPSDPSTAFLEEIIVGIQKRVDGIHYSILRIDCTDASHKAALDEIRKTGYSSVIFFGHGTSTSLKGSSGLNYSKEVFISNREFQVFNGKQVFLLACDSSVLLKATRREYAVGLGFEDLPTDWDDVQVAREADANAYKSFTEKTIESFRAILIQVIKNSLIEFMSSSQDMHDLRASLLLRVNKAIADSYKSGDMVLSECLLKVRKGICLYESK